MVDVSDTKHCTKCDRELPLEAFGVDRCREDGRHPYCRECRNAQQRHAYATNREVVAEGARWRAIKHRYGITRTDWLTMCERQGGTCAICPTPLALPVGTRKDKSRSVVDHCHETGRVRGLLCGRCNLGIGYLDHDVERLEAAIRYLQNST